MLTRGQRRPECGRSVEWRVVASGSEVSTDRRSGADVSFWVHPPTELANLGPVVQALEVDDLHIGSTRCMGKKCGVEGHTEKQEFRIARSCT